MEIPTSCPICSGCYMSYVKSLPTKHAGPVDLFYCMSCESFSSPFSVPFSGQQSEVEWHKSVISRNRAWGKELFEILRVKSGLVLDVGCGIGSYLLEAREAGLSAVGFDLDKDAVDFGCSEFQLDLRSEMWTTKLGLKTNLILCINVLEHIHQPRALLEELITASNTNSCPLFIALPFVVRAHWPHFKEEDTTRAGNLFEYPHVHVAHFSEIGFQKAAEDLGAKTLKRLKVGQLTGYLING